VPFLRLEKMYAARIRDVAEQRAGYGLCPSRHWHRQQDHEDGETAHHASASPVRNL
jgi:hypothetical protein